jgi:imidazolonepropionase
MSICADLVITNTSQVITLSGPDSPRTGGQMSELGIVHRGAIAVAGGRIVWVGPEKELPAYVKVNRMTRTINACRCAVLPGFVESHTHLVFAGTREEEFSRKIAGIPYMQIASEGGGIKRTVRDTRSASEEMLYKTGIERIREALRFGITTIEIKSGYGLDFESEKKILKVAKLLGETTPVEIVNTFLGAHEIPYDKGKADYLDEICYEMIPYIAEHKLAEFCDVFCEKGVFSLDEAERVLKAGIKHGLQPKIHADQMTLGGGAELAARLGAVSADHLDYTSARGIRAMSENKVVGVLLPGAVFFLGLDRYPPAREMISGGVPVALSTDFNPGSCMSLNIHLMMTIACVRCRMTIPETITATTINAACAVNRQDITGSLSPGKRADIVILDCSLPEMIPYHFGHNHVRHVFCSGRQVVDNAMVLPF